MEAEGWRDWMSVGWWEGPMGQKWWPMGQHGSYTSPADRWASDRCSWQGSPRHTAKRQSRSWSGHLRIQRQVLECSPLATSHSFTFAVESSDPKRTHMHQSRLEGDFQLRREVCNTVVLTVSLMAIGRVIWISCIQMQATEAIKTASRRHPKRRGGLRRRSLRKTRVQTWRV